MPIAPKMHSLDTEVGRYQQLVAGRNAEDGAVIADAGDHGAGSI
jgi:hypothetical protein